MKTSITLLLALILVSCGSGSSTSDKTQEETGTSASEAAVDTSEEFSLTENDHYQSLFNASVCEKLSNEQIASLLNIPADQIKKSTSSNNNIRCGWGYYPEDRKAGKNISVILYEDEYITEKHYKNDKKAIGEGNWVSQVNLDVPNVALATYRKDRGWLKVYISKTRMMEFQIGPTMQTT